MLTFNYKFIIQINDNKSIINLNKIKFIKFKSLTLFLIITNMFQNIRINETI